MSWLNEDGTATPLAMQLAAVEELADCDHLFLEEAYVHKLTEPFGFKGSTYLAHNTASPDNPKGLTLRDGLTELRGQDAAEVAVEICKKLKVSYAPMFGRGSLLRSCCAALRGHLNNRQLAEECADEAAKFLGL